MKRYEDDIADQLAKIGINPEHVVYGSLRFEERPFPGDPMILRWEGMKHLTADDKAVLFAPTPEPEKCPCCGAVKETR